MLPVAERGAEHGDVGVSEDQQAGDLRSAFRQPLARRNAVYMPHILEITYVLRMTFAWTILLNLDGLQIHR